MCDRNNRDEWVDVNNSDDNVWLQHQPRSPFVTHHHEMTLLERKHRPLCLVEEFPNDEDVLELRPAIKPRSRWDRRHQLLHLHYMYLYQKMSV